MFKSIMHVSFYTDRFEEMLDFYTNKLGGKQKVIVRFKEYLNRPDRPQFQEIAKSDPERIFYTYIELAPGQFIELFPAMPNQKEHSTWNEYKGYSHFALLVDDIYKTREELKAKGITPVTDISKGPSNTYQMWIADPDDNRFECMQYTEDSWQVRGHM